MPNVPNVPGVPPLSSFASSTITLLTADALSFLGVGVFPQWGLFLNGVPVVTAESVNSFEYSQEWRIANYPIEQGKFASYDKVYMPFGVRIRFASGGSVAKRLALIASLDAIAGDLNLYSAVTPERVYDNVNVERLDYSRAAARGLGILVVDVHVVQINQTGSVSFQNTQSSSGTDAVSGGTVQPQAASPQQLTSVLGAVN